MKLARQLCLVQCPMPGTLALALALALAPWPWHPGTFDTSCVLHCCINPIFHISRERGSQAP